MKKQNWITIAHTTLNFAIVFAVLWAVLVMFSGCGATASVCPAYKVKPKVERTTQHSRASDAKPRISRGYVNCVGCR